MAQQRVLPPPHPHPDKNPRNWVEIPRKVLRRLVSGRLSWLIAFPRPAQARSFSERGGEVGKSGGERDRARHVCGQSFGSAGLAALAVTPVEREEIARRRRMEEGEVVGSGGQARGGAERAA